MGNILFGGDRTQLLICASANYLPKLKLERLATCPHIMQCLILEGIGLVESEEVSKLEVAVEVRFGNPCQGALHCSNCAAILDCKTMSIYSQLITNFF